MPGERHHRLAGNDVAGVADGAHAGAHARVLSDAALLEFFPIDRFHVARVEQSVAGDAFLVVFVVKAAEGDLVLQAREAALDAGGVLEAFHAARPGALFDLSRQQTKHLPLADGVVERWRRLIDDVDEGLDRRADHEGRGFLIPGAGGQNDIGVKRRGVPAPVDANQETQLGQKVLNQRLGAAGAPEKIPPQGEHYPRLLIRRRRHELPFLLERLAHIVLDRALQIGIPFGMFFAQVENTAVDEVHERCRRHFPRGESFMHVFIEDHLIRIALFAPLGEARIGASGGKDDLIAAPLQAADGGIEPHHRKGAVGRAAVADVTAQGEDEQHRPFD